ncbi:zinc transporter ZIP10 [Girardinichthys multiradiatus]|uniref:zinc transporter ZIP10 n=1 Tax=Girardinichthys multiradiatus TaxID=208333 RepID=UPI001FAE279E|nr:zinc transporter ZIP10 [Girardinichthys multiradiatus]XP_047226087.1 zinc transporter ZIP10 [Girardinichthys multiradiatus]
MQVHVHTKFCFLCVLTFIFHHCNHCHVEGHGHPSDGHQHNDLQISEAPYVHSATVPPESNSPEGGPLEEEQRFYIQQLFRRYGQKDRLDFQGFQSLLLSLGLGEVKLVSVDHEDLGHDHVAHLDLLDVQEGLHSHSSSSEGHSHDHQDHKPHHPRTEQAPTHCSHTTASSPATGSPTKHDHDHSDTQKHTDDHNHDHTHDEDHQHQHTEIQSNHKDLSSAPHHGPRSYSGDQHNHKEHTDKQLPPAHMEPLVGPTDDPPKRTQKTSKVRGQQRPNKFPSSETPPSGDHERNHSHSHKEKREAPGLAASQVLTEHPGGLMHQHEECLNLTQLLNYYGLHPDSIISPSEFTYLCPALLYQIDSRVCIRHYHQMEVEQEALEPVSSVWIWIWGFVSITIISLLSLLGVVLVPILKQSCFKFLLTFLVALAVGTLSGDALLHLLPHSQGQHDHSPHETSNSSDLVTAFDGVWKGLTALAGIYLLFIIEHCIGMFKHYKDQRELKKENEARWIGRKLSDHKSNRRSDAEWLNLKPLNEDPENSAVSCDNTHNDTQLTELQDPDTPTNKTPLAPTNPLQDKQSPTKDTGRKARKHGHSHGGNCHSDQEMKDAGIASIAWMVIMGDGMHNFSDGLAIGAAFSANITGGISTSVAVFCHELPHELGDFAVLLKAGMSVKQAIVYNLLSALMAYVGMLIGTAVGQYTHNVTNWIFAITAGMFLYVALVDMVGWNTPTLTSPLALWF